MQGLLSYTFSVTGDCQNTSLGAIELIVGAGGFEPISIDWTSPNLGTDIGSASTRTNLSAGTYQVVIQDSYPGSPNVSYVNLYMTSGFCISTMSTDTTCSQSDGTLQISVNPGLNTDFYLYSLNTGYVSSGNSVIGDYIFTNLDSDVYYIDAVSYGGCTGRSATCIIKNSGGIDFGLFTINNSNCSSTPSGKIYVTGLTGNGPFTYVWSQYNSGGPSIENVPAGLYQVTVTNSEGCSITKSAMVGNSLPLTITNMIPISPSCFQSDGQFIVNVNGGTPPYLYQLSNGYTDISFSQSYTFSGLAAGTYTATTTDGGLCTATYVNSLSTPNSFQVIGVIGNNSFCNSNNGSVTINVVGGVTPYTYTITDSSGNTRTSASTSTSLTFNNLQGGPYVVSVSNPSQCFYQTSVYINTINKFNISATTVNTSCGLNNGTVTLSVDTPGTYDFQLDNTHKILGSTQTSQTFTNISPGLYHAFVKDNTNCFQYIDVNVSPSSSVQFTLIGQGCGTGSEGSITAVITDGTPPFTFNWSQNVNGQTGIYVTGLTAGTYTLTVTDFNGCESTKSKIITCNSDYTGYKVYNICTNNFIETPLAKTGIGQMFYQGFKDLTANDGYCELQSADFTLILNVGGTAYTSNFYHSIFLIDYPTDTDYANALKLLLNSVPGIGAIIVDPTNNLLQITSDCLKQLAGKNITIDLKIDYDVCCECALDADIIGTLITPTPSPTPTVTPTPTLTPTPTPTPTLTPTPTPTPIPCYCYVVDSPYQTEISWIDCDGNNQSQKITASLYYLCAQEGTVSTADQDPSSASTISGGTSVCSLESDCWPTSGCDCYIWEVNGMPGGYNITYYDCNDNLVVEPVDSGINPIYGVCGYNAYVGEWVDLQAIRTPYCQFNGTEYICPETFTIYPKNLTTARIHQIISSSGYTVDWGDGTYTNFSAGNNLGAQHTYGSPYTPYTGEIKILSANLGSITTFRTDISIGTGVTNPSLLITGSELYKLSGLTYFGNVYSTFTGNTSEVPNNLQTFYSLKGKLSGDINDLPNTLKSLTLGGYETNNLSGNTINFPSGMTYIYINGGTNTINGDIKDIPTGLTYFGIWGYNTISGDTSDIHTGITNFYLYGYNTLRGDISNISSIATSFVVYGNNSLSGDTSSITSKTSLRTFVVANGITSTTGNTIDGDINNIPKKIDTFEVRGFNTIYGDIINMPTGSTVTGTNQYFNLTGLNTVSGQASDISYHVSNIFLSGYNTLSGDTGDFPSNIEVMWISGLNKISGDIANLPPNAWSISLAGPTTVKNYTMGRTWAPDMNEINIIPSSSGTNFISTSELDDLLIDLTGTTWSYSPRFGNPVINLVGTASTTSSAARIKLSGSTPTGYGVSLTLN